METEKLFCRCVNCNALINLHELDNSYEYVYIARGQMHVLCFDCWDRTACTCDECGQSFDSDTAELWSERQTEAGGKDICYQCGGER